MAHDHSHSHDHGPPPTAQDAAERSLADALRVSFRLLTLIMVLVVAAFLATGFRSVDTTERGLVMRFGRIVRPASPGFVYTWPFPVGEIELVSVKEKSLTVDDFWMHETPEEMTTPLIERRPRGQGLRPGWDGALLTADRYLIHARLICTYRVADVEKWKLHVADEAETVRAAVCTAAVRAAATRTADRLQRFQRDAFENAVKLAAQETLDKLGAGIEINTIQSSKMTWPLRALPAFNEVTSALQQMDKQISDARGEAASILNNAAGAAYRMLVGVRQTDAAMADLIDRYRQAVRDAVEADAKDKTEKVGDARGLLDRVDASLASAFDRAMAEGRADDAQALVDRIEVGLIGQYERAARAGDADAAGALLDEIDHVLLTQATGQVAQVIQQARAQSSRVRERIEGYAQQLERLLESWPAEDAEGRRLMLERLWADTVEKVLSAPLVEKYYVSPGPDGRFVLRIPRDSEIVRKILRERYKAEQEARKASGSANP